RDVEGAAALAYDALSGSQTDALIRPLSRRLEKGRTALQNLVGEARPVVEEFDTDGVAIRHGLNRDLTDPIDGANGLQGVVKDRLENHWQENRVPADGAVLGDVDGQNVVAIPRHVIIVAEDGVLDALLNGRGQIDG